MHRTYTDVLIVMHEKNKTASSLYIYIMYTEYVVINPRRACAARVTVVGSVCVCVSTKHLTYRMFIRPTNDTTYLTANEDQKICGVFSENAPLQS